MKKLVSRESLDLMQHFVGEQNLLKKYLISLRLKKKHTQKNGFVIFLSIQSTIDNIVLFQKIKGAIL